MECNESRLISILQPSQLSFFVTWAQFEFRVLFYNKTYRPNAKSLLFCCWGHISPVFQRLWTTFLSCSLIPQDAYILKKHVSRKQKLIMNNEYVIRSVNISSSDVYLLVNAYFF